MILYSVDTAAKELNMSIRTLWRIAKESGIMPTRMGQSHGKCYWTPEQVERLRKYREGK
jgi:hypothetical protein